MVCLHCLHHEACDVVLRSRGLEERRHRKRCLPVERLSATFRAAGRALSLPSGRARLRRRGRNGTRVIVRSRHMDARIHHDLQSIDVCLRAFSLRADCAIDEAETKCRQGSSWVGLLLRGTDRNRPQNCARESSPILCRHRRQTCAASVGKTLDEKNLGHRQGLENIFQDLPATDWNDGGRRRPSVSNVLAARVTG